MLPVPDSLNLNLSLEEVIQFIESPLRLSITQVLPLSLPLSVRVLGLSYEVLLVDPLTALDQEIVNQVAV